MVMIRMRNQSKRVERETWVNVEQNAREMEKR